MFLTNVLLKKKAKSKHQRRKLVFSKESLFLYIPDTFGLFPQELSREVWEFIMVLMESMVSGHKFTWIRERLTDKVEMVRFDPYIQHESVYKEKKKIKSMKF